MDLRFPNMPHVPVKGVGPVITGSEFQLTIVQSRGPVSS